MRHVYFLASENEDLKPALSQTAKIQEQEYEGKKTDASDVPKSLRPVNN